MFEKNFLRLIVATTFLFAISPAQWSIKNISKHLFHLIRSSTKIVEFDNVKFPKICQLKIVFEENFLRLIVTVCFFKKREFSYPFYQSINYNNLVATKHIYVSPNSENRGFTSLIILQV